MYKRSIYTALDWVGDLGGLADGLRLMGYMLMWMYGQIQGNPLSAYLL